MLKARSVDRSSSSTISGDQEGTHVDSHFADPKLEPVIDRSPQPGVESAFAQVIQRHLRTRRGLLMHGFLFAVVAVDLLILYILTNGITSWTIWPMGVWAVILASHAGSSIVRSGFFGIHLFGGAAICAGLVVINIIYGGAGWWAIWPILAWLFSLVIHLPFAYDLITLNDLHRKTPVRPQDR